jgi:hypothetical protein
MGFDSRIPLQKGRKMAERPPVNLPDIETLIRFSLSDGDFSDRKVWKTGELEAYIGGFSDPSKMPGKSFGIPAVECGIGSKLRDKKGSTCSGCYAMKGAYVWKGTILAYYRRFDRLANPYWAEVIAELLNRRINNKNGRYFRWHDAGDLQSIQHLAEIVKIAQLCPDVSFWLPTREYRIVAEYRKLYGDDSIPANLVIRLSAHMVGGKAPSFPNPLTISTVSITGTEYESAHNCPAPLQDNSCGDCRACWSSDVPHVDYHLH